MPMLRKFSYNGKKKSTVYSLLCIALLSGKGIYTAQNDQDLVMLAAEKTKELLEADKEKAPDKTEVDAAEQKKKEPAVEVKASVPDKDVIKSEEKKTEDKPVESSDDKKEAEQTEKDEKKESTLPATEKAEDSKEEKKPEDKKEAEKPEPIAPPVVSQPVVTPSPAPTVAVVAPDPSKKVEPQGPLFEETTGLETIDVEEGGNWLLKRQVLERTIDTIEQVNEVFNAIVMVNTDYQIKRNKMDNAIESFVLNLGIEVGDLDQELTQLNDYLEKASKNIQDMPNPYGEVTHDVNQLQEETVVIHKDLKYLLKIDDKLDAVIDTVTEQLKQANEYQGQVWRHFQSIKKTLNDERARDLYYQVEGLFKSMQAIHEYLQTKLMAYFNETITAANKKMESVKIGLDALKSKGVDLRAKANKEIESVEDKQAREKEEKEKAAKTKEISVEKPSLINQIVYYITWPFTTVYTLVADGFKTLWQYLPFGSPKKKKDTAKAAVEESTVPQEQIVTVDESTEERSIQSKETADAQGTEAVVKEDVTIEEEPEAVPE